MLTGIESASLKIKRAEVHIEALKTEVWRYTGIQPDGIAREIDGKEEPIFTEPPPPYIAILAGETLYQLRSTLDHLALELVKVRFPTCDETACSFPLFVKTPVNTPLPYGEFDMLPRISKRRTHSSSRFNLTTDSILL